MPLFKARVVQRSPTLEKVSNGGTHYGNNHCHQNGNENDQEATDADNNTRAQKNNAVSHNQTQEQRRSSRVSRPPLVFHCQLAHGSPTGLISGFSNVRELYQKIAECYELPVEEILFCTLNTHKIEMTELLGSQIGVGDFIFAHKKGRPKEIELVKSGDALGLTITDNGAGYAFIKRIKEGSVIDRIKVIEVGDHIEKINSDSLVGKRHFEVAKMLKEIPKGSTFTLRLIEPLKNGFGNIGPRGDLKKGKKSGYGSGKETLRFKADGSAQIIEMVDDAATIGIEKINVILESFMGIYDTELATQIWELAEGKGNSIEFAEAIDNSDLEAFGFTDDFVIELWGAVTDARAGRHR
ncbi:PDZ domain-containing protein GIPC3 [Colletes gigas]|uniref:PDZ domain-containing protein GIPC3 n=1 Tax=Colletes gigas TaxID=935657 RepID=UPI001C9B08EB|nr:PDZ domain-containing protein GIPC3 [Colletes gigas]XP_043256409.1 PDZ domain-containing protein GIPC3 [Colletes gigas]